MKKAIENAINALGHKVYADKVMVNGTLYPLPLVRGNSKLGKNVWHSSTVPTNGIITAVVNGEEISERGTCPMFCEGCYGTVNNFRYNPVKYSLIMRTRLLREHTSVYFALVRIQLTYENIERLRIHAVGDFIESEAIGFYNVLKDFPNVKTWTYTKCKMNADIKKLASLKNVNIVKSVIPSCGFNFGHCDYILNVYHHLLKLKKSVYICRCGIDKNQHCSDCDGCSGHEYVLFIEHSTKYKAENDSVFPTLKQVIESQPK